MLLLLGSIACEAVRVVSIQLLLTSAESIYRASNANPYLTSLKC